jgi:chemotaxis protein CheX
MTEQKKAVLIVDDEADIRELVAELVTDEFPAASVIQASNGSEAMMKLGRQRFDLVITDLRMPRMDGNTLIQRIRALDPHLKPKHVIVLSGFIDQASAARTVGSVSYLSKPFKPEDLLGLVGGVLKGTLPAAEKKAPPENFKMDVTFINPFIDAVILVLSTTASTEVTRESLFVRTNDQISGDISAVIAMRSSVFTGSMAVAFEDRCFLDLVGKMLGDTFTEITPDIQDAAGELCNQIFGVAKRKLNEKGFDIQMAIPSVIIGKGHRIKHMVDGNCLAVRFKTDAGHLTIEAVLQGTG